MPESFTNWNEINLWLVTKAYKSYGKLEGFIFWMLSLGNEIY